jgi:hypothetical protein
LYFGELGWIAEKIFNMVYIGAAPLSEPSKNQEIQNEMTVNYKKIFGDEKKRDIYETYTSVNTKGIDSVARANNLFAYSFLPSNAFVRRNFETELAKGIVNLKPSEEDKKLFEGTQTFSQAGGGGDTKYHYLKDSILTRELEDALEDESPQCIVHICIYSIDRSCNFVENEEPIPFLKFLVKPLNTDSKKYGFFTFEYSAADDNFKCVLYENLFDLLDLSIAGINKWCDREDMFGSIYKGFKLDKINDEYHVFAFFDYDEILKLGASDSSVEFDETGVLEDVASDKPGVLEILKSSGLGIPKYYSWRSRSGCTFCFFQQKIEWVHLKEIHPIAFEREDLPAALTPYNKIPCLAEGTSGVDPPR